MIDLGDSSKWSLIYNLTHLAQPRPNRPGKHFPITPVIIPTPLDYYTIAIHSSVESAKQTWRLGGIAYSVIEVPGSPIVVSKIGKGYFVEINFPTVIQIVKVSTRYRLAFYFPKWFVSANLKVWVYTDTVPLGTIEDRLTNIEGQLTRIEQELLNNMTQ